MKGIDSELDKDGTRYIKDSHPDKGDYYKYCGQDFRYFISGEKTLYTDISEPLITNAKEKDEEEFRKEYVKVVNKLTKEFTAYYCDEEGNIDWGKTMLLNPASKRITRDRLTLPTCATGCADFSNCQSEI